MELMIAQWWNGVKWENLFVFWMVECGDKNLDAKKERYLYGQ